MENKDLLFMLENGEEFIKGIYEAKEDKIYFLSACEDEKLKNVGEYANSLVHIYEENRIEVELLIEKILEDTQLLDKVKNHHSNKLLFRYKSREFERVIGIR